VTPGQEVLARRFRRQGAWCQEEGEALYAVLLERTARDVEAGGACWAALSPYAGEPGENAVPLRFMAAVHWLVLTGRAPALAAHYPSMAGTPDPDGAWADFLAVVEANAGLVREKTARGCQTNEVGRSAALLPAFLTVAQASGGPLRLLEVGCSAGLNLRFDHFWYGSWGDPSSPVRLDGMYEGDPPRQPSRVRVLERAGCDLDPIDPTSEEGEQTLAAFTWPSNPLRMERLRGAVRIAREVPAQVDRADAVEWLEAQLDTRRTRVTTVVYHSVFLQYLAESKRAALRQVIERAARGAVADAPIAWVRMEPGKSTFEVRCALWPGGRDVLLGTCGPHGRGFAWAA
jgi:hypothetical protein